MRRLLPVAVRVSGCQSTEGVAPAARAPLLRAHFEGPGIGDATVRVGGICGGTLIAPDRVLTAGHCVLGIPELRVSARSGDPSVRTNGCYIHPDAAADTTVHWASCSQSSPNRDEYGNEHDLALYHLERPIAADLPYRALRVPRPCPGRCEIEPVPSDSTTFDTAVRFRSYGVPDLEIDPDYMPGERLLDGCANATIAPGTDFTSFSGITAESGTGFVRGDSGGTCTFLHDDAAGPPIGVIVATPRANPRVGIHTNVWAQSNIDWIWSVLDPNGRCVFGSTRPCVFQEPTPPGGDVCGDAHCTGPEDQQTCPQDCVVTWPDSDGDGLPDIRDFCPAFDGRRPDAHMDATGQHVDSDGDYVGDDCESPAFDPCGPDRDGDRVVDSLDNCADTPNVLQTDCDGDGQGDACEGVPDTDGDGWIDTCDDCVEVPNPGQEDCDGDGQGDACDDEDADGVLDLCFGPGGDNCPVPNPAQTNCNADAERVLGLMPRGDVCDPTPCGQSRLETRTVVEGWSRRLVMDGIRVDARASMPIEARLGYRFCPCELATGDNPESRRACNADADGARCFLARADLYDSPEQFDRMRSRWRDATVGSYGAGIEGPLDDPADPTDGLIPTGRRTGDFEALEECSLLTDPATGELLEIEQTDLRGRWALRDIDELRWYFGEYPTEPRPPFVPRAWAGVFATHAPGPRRGFFDDATRQRAFHYWSGIVPLPEPLPRRPPFPCFRLLLPFLFPDVCVFCGASFPEPFLTLGGILSAGQCVPRDADVFLGLADGFLPGNPYFAGGAPYFSTALRWVAASEPRAWLPRSGARYVGFDAAAQAVSVVLVERNGAVVPQSPEPCPNCPPPNLCPGANCPGAPGFVAPSAAAASTAAEPASGSVLVLSSRRNTLFAIAAGGISAFDLAGGGGTVDLEPSRALGQPLAAVYVLHDDALYVIEEATRGGRARETRLVRVDPDTGIVETLARWPRTGWSRRFAMAAGEDGSLWIAASGERGAHFVAWLDVRGARVTVRGAAVGVGAISAAGARANGAGLSLALDGPGEPRVVGYRAEHLLGRSMGLDRLF